MPPLQDATWVEIHVDDEVISDAPERCREAVRLVDRLATVAEERGARLSFRFRTTFVEGSSVSLLHDLVRRGHEVGAHSHAEGLVRVVTALRDRGIEVDVAAPGLVQAPRARGLILRQARQLGLTLVTDHGPTKAWSYEGLLPRVEEGIWVMAPAVRPPEWGLYPEGRRRPLGGEAIAQLRELEAAARRHGAHGFGVTLHEHDLCAPGTLEPLPEALDAFASYLDARVRPSLGVLPSPVPRTSERPVTDALVRAGSTLSRRVPPLRRPVRASSPPLGGSPVSLALASGRSISARAFLPEAPRALVVVSAAGTEGGCRLGLSFAGTDPLALVREGFGVLLYDRAGTGGSVAAGPVAPGNPAHTADWLAALAWARRHGVPVIGLGWSSGLLSILQGAIDGERPDAVLDIEAPADRFSLFSPRSPDARWLRPWWDDALWGGLEAVRMLPRLQRPYLRLQAEQDHVHGLDHEHARRNQEAAGAWAVRPLRILPGSIRAHGEGLIGGLHELLVAGNS